MSIGIADEFHFVTSSDSSEASTSNLETEVASPKWSIRWLQHLHGFLTQAQINKKIEPEKRKSNKGRSNVLSSTGIRQTRRQSVIDPQKSLDFVRFVWYLGQSLLQSSLKHKDVWLLWSLCTQVAHSIWSDSQVQDKSGLVTHVCLFRWPQVWCRNSILFVWRTRWASWSEKGIESALASKQRYPDTDWAWDAHQISTGASCSTKGILRLMLPLHSTSFSQIS